MENIEDANLDNLINNEDDKTKSSQDKKKKIILAIVIVSCIIIVGVVIFLIVYFLKGPNYDNGGKDPEHAFYGCMVDAGSSSSRVSVYRWPERKKNTIPFITEMNRTSTKPGMHKMTDSQIENAMDTLINFCKNKVMELSNNKTNLKDVNFYLKGTAGMRSISVEEQNRKLGIIRRKIRESNLNFLSDDWAKVIKGTEEGIYGWIAGNYLNKILFENEEAGKQKKVPYGSIDLGGYSLELTFGTNEVIKENNFTLNLSNVNYNLYTYSFHDYGQDRFNEIMLESFIDDYQAEEENVIKYPCFLEGYRTLHEYKGKNYIIEGDVNISLCKEYIRKNLKINEEPDKSMNNVYQPKIPEDLKFYGISGLYWIANFYKMDDDNFHSASEFLDAGAKFCNKKWEDAKKEYPDIEEEHLKDYCISAHFVYYFIVDGFKIDKDKKIFSFRDEINDVELSWTLGAMSYEIGLQPLKDAKYYLKF